MKKLITFLFLIAAIGAAAQVKKVTPTPVTVVKPPRPKPITQPGRPHKHVKRVKSISGDSVVVSGNSIPIHALIVNELTNDTARTYSWVIKDFSRDTSRNATATVSLFNKQGAVISIFDVAIPGKTLLQGLTAIDNYIFSKKKKIVKE